MATNAAGAATRGGGAPPAPLSVVGVYANVDQAAAAVEKLVSSGFSKDRVSLLGKDLQSEARFSGFVTAGDMAKSGAAMGAWVGGLFGLLSGAAVLFLPAAGPLVVLGPLAAMAMGAGETAVVGGALGAILGKFMERRHIPKFEAHVKAGRYLVVVHGTADEVTRAQHILEQSGAQDVTGNNLAAVA
jgi:hypothetical protein